VGTVADPKGFLKHGREVAGRRPVEERVRDWDEVYPDGVGRALLPIINTQASRCMDCGIPFCHQGCPLGNLIPEWNDLVWRDDWDGAMDRLHATNNFPEFTGRLCPPVRDGVRARHQPGPGDDQERRGLDHRPGLGVGLRPAAAAEWLSGKTVAVVGSGPPVWPAAQQLTRAGHTVAVYERRGQDRWACCATASPSSRWRRSTSTGGWTRCAGRAPCSGRASMSGPT
jgi:glutamate synthase (NADPH/NADH) small chain